MVAGAQHDGNDAHAARLRFDAVTCVRGDRILFEALSFSVEAGQAVQVLGANGTGKSSLLRVAAGLLRAAAGMVTHDGGLALSDENLALDPMQPLDRALALWSRIDRVPDVARAQAMAAMDLSHLAEVPVRMLSTGQRKRAALARVVASGAGIWLLDEPGNGLDTASLDRLGAAMTAHLARGGAIVAASHQPLPVAIHCQIDLATA